MTGPAVASQYEADARTMRLIAKALAQYEANRPSQAPYTSAAGHQVCPVCGHSGIEAATKRCPNNNCVRNLDAAVVGIHPLTGVAMYDAAAHKEAVDQHKADQAA